MRRLFFSLIFYFSILTIAAVSRGLSKVCEIPRIKRLRRGRYIELKDFKKFNSCKKEEIEHVNKRHDDEISRKNAEIKHLTDQLFNEDIYSDNSDNDYPETTPNSKKCDETKDFTISKDPKNLAEHIKCDNKNHETSDQCINRLQTLLQGFIDIHQEVEIGYDETPIEQNDRLKKLVKTERQKSGFYHKLNIRCESDIMTTARENKLASDYVKCRSELLVCENKITDLSLSNVVESDDSITNCTPTECRTGFHYDSNHCQQNICTCQNGMAITGTE